MTRILIALLLLLPSLAQAHPYNPDCVASWDSTWAPRAWLENGPDVGDTVLITGTDTVVVRASYQDVGPWQFRLLVFTIGHIDTAWQTIGLTPLDKRAWVTKASGRFSNDAAVLRDSLMWATDVVSFVGGQYENSWPLEHEVGRFVVTARGPRCFAWVHRAPIDTCNVLYRSWLDSSDRMRPVTMGCPSVALYRRFLNAAPPARIGPDSLSHWSSYRGRE